MKHTLHHHPSSPWPQHYSYRKWKAVANQCQVGSPISPNPSITKLCMTQQIFPNMVHAWDLQGVPNGMTGCVIWVEGVVKGTVQGFAFGAILSSITVNTSKWQGGSWRGPGMVKSNLSKFIEVQSHTVCVIPTTLLTLSNYPPQTQLHFPLQNDSYEHFKITLLSP